ncbi:signal-transducing adaptor protein 1-like isoform X2 [Cololabis saira]|uniref:signal-transducing adaptor protein 1-like isoform X2 n=1 Tax=Cololabis saira TaxID=129043 RepID=UPI002AD49301|nr:signal-transducing adaptor protein 1-like isoform X2 [Cololabis saira]
MFQNNRAVLKRRATITLLPLYYSGPLLKKNTREKDFKNYYGELRGATLFLYTDDTQDTYLEKLELEQLKSMELASPYQKKMPTVFTLSMQTEEVQLKMDNADRGEEWRGYIMTVVKKEIPTKLQLLPGQFMKLEEVLASEQARNFLPSRPPLPRRPTFLRSPSSSSDSSPKKQDSEMPACFFSVSRQEAERMLETNPENGSIILRPSTMPNNYAVTMRQPKDSGAILKHYRVTSTSAGFVIELDTAVTVSSLKDVIAYVLEKTDYRLNPYVLCQPYDTRIEPSPLPKCVNVTHSTSKTLPRAQVKPVQYPQSKETPPPAETTDGTYVFPDPSSYNHDLNSSWRASGSFENEERIDLHRNWRGEIHHLQESNLGKI